MPGNPVYAADLLTAGLRGDFWDTYAKTSEGLKARFPSMMELDIPSDKLTETYGYFNSAPHPRRWVRGNAIPEKGFKGVAYSVTNKDYAIKIPWHVNDRMDDQTRSLYTFAQNGGAGFALLDERALYQILTGATDLDMLESVPNAPDGVGICNATDGDGAARFGVSGGNVVSGGGVTTSELVRVDFFKTIVAFRSFQDTEGQPLHDPSIIDSGVTVTYGIANEKAFREAFGQRFSLQTAATSNIILDAGIKVTLVPTARITDNDWWVFLDGIKRKPVFRQTRQAIQEHSATMDNSDWVRAHKEESIQWDCRYGYGVNAAYGVCKVNN
jgi:phage major head subunit gpT-like protein